MTISKQGPYHILTWDWDEPPDEVIADFLQIFKEWCELDAFQIVHGGDFHCVVVGEWPTSKEEAQEAYQAWFSSDK